MLVLTRKFQEKIRIGNGITITVLRAKGKAVRLGIEAPSDVPVIRGELAFNQPQTQDETSDSVDSDYRKSTSRRQPSRPRVASVESNWVTDSHVQAADRDRETQPVAQVSLRRVPRENVGELLPQLLTGKGPLREMLNQRAATL